MPLKKAAWGLCVCVCVCPRGCVCAPRGVHAAVLPCLCSHGCLCTHLQAHRAHTGVCRAVWVPPWVHTRRGPAQAQPATGGPQGPPGPHHPPQCGLGLPQLHPKVPPAHDTALPPPSSLPRAGLCSRMLAAALLPRGRWALLPQSHRCPHPLLSPPAPSSLPTHLVGQSQALLPEHRVLSSPLPSLPFPLPSILAGAAQSPSPRLPCSNAFLSPQPQRRWDPSPLPFYTVLVHMTST